MFRFGAKKLVGLLGTFGFIIFGFLPTNAMVSAMASEGATTGISIDTHTSTDEALGKELFQKFQIKKVSCVELKKEDFRLLGEYYMGLMVGENHSAMNGLIMQMIGSAGEGEMHTVMGERLTGCNPNAAYPNFSQPLLNMMQSPAYLTRGQENTGSQNCSNTGNNLGVWLSILILLPAIVLIAFLIFVIIHHKLKHHTND